jgi:hypothetical protein
MKKTLFSAALAAACLLTVSCSKDSTTVTKTYRIDFSDLTLEENSHRDSGAFRSGKAEFLNSYNAEYASWGGFAYSNQNDTSASGAAAQFDVYTATPNAKGIFAVGYVDTYTPALPTVTFDEPVALKSAAFALNAYAYKIMRDGNKAPDAKKFAAGDWYKITIKSVDRNNVALDSLEVYLADFRNGKTILIDRWTEFSLAPLKAHKLTFEASSTDNGAWGMNTPAYFCIDDIAFEAYKEE